MTDPRKQKLIGMEQVRVRSQHATPTRVAVSNIALLPIEMARKRRKKRKTEATTIGTSNGGIKSQNNIL